jgi:DNA-binding IclR family transcriptional regulator
MAADTNRGSGRPVARALGNATEPPPATVHRLPDTPARRGRIERHPHSRWYLPAPGGLGLREQGPTAK